MDPSAFKIQYDLEHKDNIGAADLHLMMKVEMLGPFPCDGKFVNLRLLIFYNETNMLMHSSCYIRNMQTSE
jgi:hypothetical protein